MSRVAQLIGETVGNYKILDVLGEGGMGAVYKAEHILIGKKVALKMLHAEYSQKPEIIRRFFTEAKAVNKIGHRNIVDISDYGQSEDGRPYFIMELLEGRELAKEIERTGPMELGRALHIVKQVASALEASHKAGIVHRDLKPENIFLLQMGEDKDFVKLLDFGIAKLQEGAEGATFKTKTGLVMGTPAYMAPEQAEGVGVDHRTDIYSLGIIFYEMLTGEQPFSADTFSRVLIKVLTEPVPPPRVKNPRIPDSVEAVLLKMVEKEKSRRFQSMGEVIEALSHAESEAMSTDLPAPPRPAAPRSSSTTTLSGVAAEVSRSPYKGPSRLGVILGGVASVLGAAAIVAYVMIFHQEPEKAEPAPTPLAVSAPSPVSQPASTPAAPEEKAKIKLEFSSAPAGATVSEGDKILGQTPFVIEVESSENPMTLTFSLEGYETQTKTIIPNVNRATDFTLVRAKVKNAKTAKDKATSKDTKTNSQKETRYPDIIDATTTLTPKF